MKSDPQDQARLLALQEKDTRISQLDHRAATLPEAAQLAELETLIARVRDQRIAAETIADDLKVDQTRADGDVEQVRARARHDQELLDSGTINDSKQLQNLQHELESLARRQSELEDVELEIMERVEGADAAVRVLTEELDARTVERDVLAEQVRAALEEISVERGMTVSERTAIAGDVPPDLLALYEKIRIDAGGVGAAHLHRGRCEGCRLQLPPNEIEALRATAADEVVRCEECRRILVRTVESGL